MHIEKTLLALYLYIAMGFPISQAECKVPNYKKGLIPEESARAVAMNVSIPVDSFAPRSLVCLANHLQKQYVGNTALAASRNFPLNLMQAYSSNLCSGAECRLT